MQFDPELWLRIRDKKITPHQIEILSELDRTHSQTQAASNLGISVPVLHRHLQSLINKLSTTLVVTTPNGTWLTKEGRAVLKIYKRYQEMLRPEDRIILCCTPITNDLLVEAITDFETQGKRFVISVNDDSHNIKALYLGRADLVLFDDPNYAIEFEGAKEDRILTVDIFQDTLVHIDNGTKYIRFKFGAQRLGFRYLEAEQKDYEIIYDVSNYKHLLTSNKSFFINQSILTRNKISLSSASSLKMFVHPIIGVSINPTEDIFKLVKALREKAVDL